MFQTIELNKDSFENDKRHIQHIHVEDLGILYGSCVCMAISGVLCANRGFAYRVLFGDILCYSSLKCWCRHFPSRFWWNIPPDNSPNLVLDILGSYIVGRALRLPVGLSPPTSLFSATCALIGQRHATIVWLLGYIYIRAACPSWEENRGEQRREIWKYRTRMAT